MKDIVERLRERLIQVRKPGAVPFDMPQGGLSRTWTPGEVHKVGDSAGHASVNMNLTGACGNAPSVFKMVEMVYAEAPLEWEAAAEIERLRESVNELRSAGGSIFRAAFARETEGKST